MPNPYLQASQYKPYDNFEAKTGFYRFSAGKLIGKMLPLVEGSATAQLLVYDAGCGTGNSALEALTAFRGAKVTGIDASESMLAYARIKFGFEKAGALIRDLVSSGDVELALFLARFIREAAPHAGRVGFRQADLMELIAEPADLIVGAHILHWLKPESEAAAKFAALTKETGVIAFSSSMSFYKPQKHTTGEVSYLYHPFVLSYFEILSAMIERESGKAVHAPAPEEKKHPDETIAIFRAAGFELVEYDELLLPRLKPDVLLSYNLRLIPAHIGMFEGTSLPDETQSRLMSEAIRETLSSHLDLLPLEGTPSDCNPIFVFRKK